MEKKDVGEVEGEDYVVVEDGCGEEKPEVEVQQQLPGFRFHPTDEELVGFYLRHKVYPAKKPLRVDHLIKEADIYKFDPWDLPQTCTVETSEKELYFFCLRGRKYRNSIRPNRVTGFGFWKATGIDRPVYSSSASVDGSECIGLKKSLVYYRGSAGKGVKTDWMMHEFRLPPPESGDTTASLQEAEVWTICKIFKRNAPFKKYPAQVWRSSENNSCFNNTGDHHRLTASADLSSSNNNSSLEYAAGDHEYNSNFPATAPATAVHHQRHNHHHQQQDEHYYQYLEEKSQVFQEQEWNQMGGGGHDSTGAGEAVNSCSNYSIGGLLGNELLFQESNWEELMKSMDSMDPIAALYDC